VVDARSHHGRACGVAQQELEDRDLSAAVTMREPPLPPTQRIGRSPSNTIVGDIVETGRRPGPGRFALPPGRPNAFAAPSSRAKSSISSFITMPSTVKRAPKGRFTVVVSEATLPSRSTTQTWLVP
jgi:hypothetical protein